MIGPDSISGTLKHVTDYTGFSSVKAEQTGNYLALKVDTEPADATVTVEIIGGTKGAVTLDDDGLFVGKISNKDTQSIKVVATSGDYVVTKIYSLNGLTLAVE